MTHRDGALSREAGTAVGTLSERFAGFESMASIASTA